MKSGLPWPRISSSPPHDGAAKSEEKPQNEVVEPEVASDSQDKKPSGDVHDAEIEQVLEEAKKAVDDKSADDTK